MLSRINAAGLGAERDVSTCGGKTRLPTEREVVETKGGCFASVSVGKASTKGDAGRAEQAVVLRKLGPVLGCLP